MNILFDSKGAQVQIQRYPKSYVCNGVTNPPHARLITWYEQLTASGYQLNFTDHAPISSELLSANKLFVITTHQYTALASLFNPETNFSYTANELGALQSWVNSGGSLLLFVNHSYPIGKGPYWPINDIQLAASLGITTTFAEFGTLSGNLVMTPNPGAPAAIINGVNTLEAWDSGGISPVVPEGMESTVLVPLPTPCIDHSGLNYDPTLHAFSVLYKFGQGRVIIVGHSGILGDNNTNYPSLGQISSADNLTFVMNCVAYLTNPSD